MEKNLKALHDNQLAAKNQEIIYLTELTETLKSKLHKYINFFSPPSNRKMLIIIILNLYQHIFYELNRNYSGGDNIEDSSNEIVHKINEIYQKISNEILNLRIKLDELQTDGKDFGNNLELSRPVPYFASAHDQGRERDRMNLFSMNNSETIIAGECSIIIPEDDNIENIKHALLDTLETVQRFVKDIKLENNSTQYYSNDFSSLKSSYEACKSELISQKLELDSTLSTLELVRDQSKKIESSLKSIHEKVCHEFNEEIIDLKENLSQALETLRRLNILLYE